MGRYGPWPAKSEVATTNVAERGPHVSCLSCGGLYFSANSANSNAKTELRLA